MAYSSLSLSVSAEEYSGSLSMFMQVLAVGRCSSPEPEEWMQNLGYSSCKGGGVQLAVGLCVFSTTYTNIGFREWWGSSKADA